MTFFMEYLRKKLGWCPNAAVTGTVRRRYAAPAGEVGMAREGNRDVVEGALVDYGPIGTPGRLFILLVAGALLTGCLVVLAPAVGLFVLVIILAYSGMEIYGVMRRARVEVTPDTITITRLFRPIVIPKDAVVKVEVKENKLPIPYWLLVGALAMIFLSAAGGIYYGLSNPASMRFISGLGAVIFFPVIIYRTYVRTRYPRALTITTPKKIAAIYTDDPERIARTLGVAG
ncbi:hypothetical protein L21_1073 [Methanoculleus chikugoensis]|jgi:hypothetical protein|uniref:DUF1673 family protein n=1 Tax=Methanoculleus chikugoensis TaxID=118126 RepID=A0A1M4MJS4_9EURY|nr:DUF1673 family protein [Methanoculleus chikugoensis]MDD4566737.1 DUF1673 family protein [Methanoculleus chikugoensis]SCL75181.1 hypothetical protein L21_1073 [Methanoculleus chikugoensis]